MITVTSWSPGRSIPCQKPSVPKSTLPGPARKSASIRDRGSLREGCAADLLLFDPATVGRGARTRANDLPAAATRVVTKSCGVHGVWVNGQRVADEQGAVHKPLPGKLLREWH